MHEHQLSSCASAVARTSSAAHRRFLTILLVITASVCLARAANPTTGDPAASSGSLNGPVINVSDVDRFYKTYDAAGGRPHADNLQHDYLDLGTEGLKTFAKIRRISGSSIAAAIEKKPALYTDARRCAAVLPNARERLSAAMQKLAHLYPDAQFPPITIAVGHGRPVGTATPNDGVMIGLEALCAVKYFDADVEDRFVHVIAHEYIHVQQRSSLMAGDNPTVLQLALAEGAAEFIGEIISGGIGNPGIQAEAKGREMQIEKAFVLDEDTTDLSNWAFNGTLDQPGDLAYWVGYRIVKTYYQHAADERAAVREIIQITDPKAFLAKSGWRAGIEIR
jgi:hypothetical protein